MKSVPSLHTGRCSLSAITRSDIPVLRQILDDPETQRFLPELCKEFQTAESLQQFIVSFDKYLAQDEGLLWAHWFYRNNGHNDQSNVVLCHASKASE